MQTDVPSQNSESNITDNSDSQPTPTGKLNRVGLAALVLFALASLAILANNGADPDLWGHVQFGRDVLRDGYIHATTTYSFTANGYRWINHENLSELALAFTYDNMGIAGLIAGKLLLAIGLILLLIRCGLRNGAGAFSIGIILFLVANRLTVHWHFRPQISSFIFCGLMLALLSYCFQDWHSFLRRETQESVGERHQRLRWLWLMPVILFLWANSHGGFVAGVCIYSAFLGGKTIEVFLKRKPDSIGFLKRFVLMGLVGVLATLINPYGPNLHLWLLQSLGEARPEIRDWHSIDLFSSHGTQFLIIVFLAAPSLATTKRPRDWTKIAIMALVCWQAYSHIRHMAFFVLLFGFWVPEHFESLLQQLKGKLNSSNNPAFSKQVAASAGHSPPTVAKWAFAAAVAILIGTCAYRCTDMPVQKADFPVEAFEYISDQKLSGKLVVTYNWAQYAIGAFGGEHDGLPVCPVAFDGRFRTCYPQQIVDMHFDFVIGDQGPGSRFRSSESGPPDDTKVLKFGQPDLVLISRRQKPSVDVMENQTEDWALLYQDGLAQLWGRKAIFDSIDHPNYVSPSERRINEQPQTGTATWPAFPKPRTRPVDRIASR